MNVDTPSNISNTPDASLFFEVDHQRVPCYFNTENIINLIGDREGYSCVLSSTNPISFAVPAIVVNRKGIFNTITLMGVPHDPVGQRLCPDKEAYALSIIIDYIKENNIAHRITAPANWCLFHNPPRGSKFVPFGSYILNIPDTREAIWTSLHQKHRNAARKARREGVETRFGRDGIEICHRIYAETMLRNGLSFLPLSSFKEMMSTSAGKVICGVAYQNGVPVSSLFAPYNLHGAYYLFGGTAEGYSGGANTLLHISAIETLSELGVERYDFVGARVGSNLTERIKGIQKFKSRFGGKLHQGYIWKKDLNKARCFLFDIASATKVRAHRASSTQDIIDQELASV